MSPSVSYAVLPCASRRGSVAAAHEAGPAEPPKPRLLDRVRETLRTHHGSRRPERAYVGWIRRYVLFRLRVLECAQLRVKDVGFSTNQLVVRGGKGEKDHVTMLPAAIKRDLELHLARAHAQHQVDLACSAGWVELPYALARKYPRAGREWAWQWVFLATRIYVDRVTGQRRRHHLHESVLSISRQERTHGLV